MRAAADRWGADAGARPGDLWDREEPGREVLGKGEGVVTSSRCNYTPRSADCL